MQDRRDDNGESREPEAPPPPPGGPPGPGIGIFDRINNYLLLVYALSCLLMNYSLAGLLYIEKMIALSLILPGIFAVLVPFYFLSRRSALGFAREYKFGRPDFKTAALVVLIATAAILPVEAFSSVFERMWAPDADYISFVLSIKPKGPGSFLLVALGIVIVAAIAEELLFRGFIQRIFERNMGGPLAVVLAGILFSLSHFNPPVIPGIAALGILYGYIYHRTGNLWYPIVAHAIYNFVTLLRLNEATEEELAAARAVPPEAGWTILSLAVFAAALWLLHRRRREEGQ